MLVSHGQRRPSAGLRQTAEGRKALGEPALAAPLLAPAGLVLFTLYCGAYALEQARPQSPRGGGSGRGSLRLSSQLDRFIRLAVRPDRLAPTAGSTGLPSVSGGVCDPDARGP